MVHIKKWFQLSILSFLLSSVTVCFMPLEKEGQGGLAAVFWLGFILGFVFQIPVSIRREKDINYINKKGISLLRFFRSKPAAVFDILLIIGLIMLALSFIVNAYPQWLMTAGIFIYIFSLEMHVIFNGKNYDYLYGET